MYYVIALFDYETEQLIKGIWEELSEQSISYIGEEVKNGRPHLTLGSYTDLDKDDYIKKLDEFYDDKAHVDITFNTIGSFLNYGTLFFSPTVTKELLEFHCNHHDYFNMYIGNANSLYLPGSWIPHCTLANKLSPEKLSEAFHYCLKRNDIIHGKIKEIALVELINDHNKSVEAPIIYSKPLKRS